MPRFLSVCLSGVTGPKFKTRKYLISQAVEQLACFKDLDQQLYLLNKHADVIEIAVM